MLNLFNKLFVLIEYIYDMIRSILFLFCINNNILYRTEHLLTRVTQYNTWVYIKVVNIC
jgi:hypothetical protein